MYFPASCSEPATTLEHMNDYPFFLHSARIGPCGMYCSFFPLPVLAIFYRLYPDGNGKFFHSKINWLPFNLEHSSPGQSFWYVMFTIFCHSVIHLEPPFRTHPLETRWFIPSTAIELSFFFEMSNRVSRYVKSLLFFFLVTETLTVTS